MEPSQIRLVTTEALALTNIKRKDWDNMMLRRQFAAAPSAGPAGHPRVFTVDQAISMVVLRHYYDEFGPSLAGRVASAFAEELKKGGDRLKNLYVVLTGDGRPVRVVARKPLDFTTHEFPVAEMRKNVVDHLENLRKDRP